MMNQRIPAVPAILAGALAGLFVNAEPASEAASATTAATARAAIVNVDGENIGEAVFEQAPSGVIVQVRVSALPPGPKGIHLHSVGACSPDFSAAKGHINPQGHRHGLRNEMPDAGDLPNLHVAADGTAAAEFFHQRVRVLATADPNDPPPLLDDDGSAIVIHAAPDDHSTQPIGGAGGRIGCGVIKAAAPETAAAAPETEAEE